MRQVEEAVFSAALALPVDARAALADRLWAGLPAEELGAPLDDEVREAWAADARRRMADVDAGKVALMPGEEVMERPDLRPGR